MGRHADIDIRMKHNYEEPYKFRLTRRTPVAIRIDGRSFHTFTKNFQKPFDDIFRNSMKETMKYLCENIQGCVFGYTQSDEITLILVDYDTLEASAFFDYEIQKLASITASMATMRFNQSFSEDIENFRLSITDEKDEKLYNIYKDSLSKGGMFDSRCFNIPIEEVCNLIYSRQIDAIRNSIQQVGYSFFDAKRLDNKANKIIKSMLIIEKNIIWENYPIEYQRGSACIRTEKGWIVDTNMPILKGEAREYVERYIIFN